MTTLTIKGEQYVLVPAEAYDRLVERVNEQSLPPLPDPDGKGRRPAVETVRAAMARNIIRRRLAAGWTREQLARRARVRVGTVSQIESGSHRSPRTTVRKIDQALESAGV